MEFHSGISRSLTGRNRFLFNHILDLLGKGGLIDPDVAKATVGICQIRATHSAVLKVAVRDKLARLKADSTCSVMNLMVHFCGSKSLSFDSRSDSTSLDNSDP